MFKSGAKNFCSSHMLSSERDDEECDARDDDSSNTAGQLKIKSCEIKTAKKIYHAILPTIDS